MKAPNFSLFSISCRYFTNSVFICIYENIYFGLKFLTSLLISAFIAISPSFITPITFY